MIDQRFSVFSLAVHGRDAPTLPALVELVRELDRGEYHVPNECVLRGAAVPGLELAPGIKRVLKVAGVQYEKDQQGSMPSD